MTSLINTETIKACIYKTLAPKLGTGVLTLDWEPDDIEKTFKNAIDLLPNYIYENYSRSNTLTLDFIKWLHRRLYPEDTKIVVYRDWKYHHNLPWEWRLHEYSPQIPTSYWSIKSDVEKDLMYFTDNYNSTEHKTRVHLLRYYFDFLRVHPFADSNLTIIAMICDLECTRYWFKPFWMLDIRFKDKQFMYYFTTYYENNIEKGCTSEEILWFIDDFNKNKLSEKIVREKEKIVIKTTAELFWKNPSLNFGQKDIIEFNKKLHPYFNKEWKQDITRQSMQNIFHPYFLTKSPEIQEKCLGQFNGHMELLTKHMMDGYINSSIGLTIDFICGIHKNIYYWLDKVKVKTTGWEEDYMIPGQFKTKPNGISRLDTPWVYLACTLPENVESELRKLISSLEEWTGYIYKKVIQFFLTFTEIHPFPDDNGKIWLMLVDLILIKNGIYPFFMSSFKQGNERRFYEMVQEYSHWSEKSMTPFYIMIAESYAHLLEQK